MCMHPQIETDFSSDESAAAHLQSRPMPILARQLHLPLACCKLLVVQAARRWTAARRTNSTPAARRVRTSAAKASRGRLRFHQATPSSPRLSARRSQSRWLGRVQSPPPAPPSPCGADGDVDEAQHPVLDVLLGAAGSLAEEHPRVRYAPLVVLSCPFQRRESPDVTPRQGDQRPVLPMPSACEALLSAHYLWL